MIFSKRGFMLKYVRIMKKTTLRKLFSELCCSVCKHDFDENSINIKREEKDLLVLQIVCQNCGKSFGLAFLGTNAVEEKDDDAFQMVDCPLPISYDDVLNAHEFIDNLEKDWTKYIPENLKDL